MHAVFRNRYIGCVANLVRDLVVAILIPMSAHVIVHAIDIEVTVLQQLLDWFDSDHTAHA